eukprot:scaffold25583_cov37-Phaeocystis_antarctica.AAC.4
MWLYHGYTHYSDTPPTRPQAPRCSSRRQSLSRALTVPGGDFEYAYGHWVAQPGGQCGNAVRLRQPFT